MNGHALTLARADLIALESGALWWRDMALLCVSDLHLGKSERVQRRGGGLLPPYDTRDTLTRLAADLDRCDAREVVCLGDSFDDIEAAGALADSDKQWIARLQAGRRWIWIEGNHDPGPVELGGSHLTDLSVGPLSFRHIAMPTLQGEVSGHYHPKVTVRARGRRITRPAFLADRNRIILPAYGTYTGGLRSDMAVLTELMRPDALAVMTGPGAHVVPMSRPGNSRNT